AHRLDGINLDLEELPARDGWRALEAVVAAAAAALRPRGLELSVDVPALAGAASLARLAPLVDRVIVMAYDESDEDGAPGPIASGAFVDAALAAAARGVAPER